METVIVLRRSVCFVVVPVRRQLEFFFGDARSAQANGDSCSKLTVKRRE